MATTDLSTGSDARERHRFAFANLANPPRLYAPRGPVTIALAAMLGADPESDVRGAIERRIAGLIDLLDVLDGDCDLEPTMGYLAPGYVDEAEGNELGTDTDDEPSLGAPEPLVFSDKRRSPGEGLPALAYGDQTTWAEGGLVGCGLHDIEDDDCDDEDGHDAEGNTDDNGIADIGGAGEQGFCGISYGYDVGRRLQGGSGL